MKTSSKILIAVIVVIILVAVGYYFYKKNKKTTPETTEDKPETGGEFPMFENTGVVGPQNTGAVLRVEPLRQVDNSARTAR